MKKLLLIMCLISTPAFATGQRTAYIPKGCQVESAEYSTGGGDKMIQYLEVLCRFPDGSLAVYIDREFSIGGAIGLGRITQPDKIVFREHDKDDLELK